MFSVAAEAPSIPLPMATQSKEVDSELVRHYSAVNELLRHFWACFPTRTPLLEQKVSNFEPVHYKMSYLAMYAPNSSSEYYFKFKISNHAALSTI